MRQWLQEFKSGNFCLDDGAPSGGPSSVMEELIRSKSTFQTLSHTLNIPTNSAHDHLKKIGCVTRYDGYSILYHRIHLLEFQLAIPHWIKMKMIFFINGSLLERVKKRGNVIMKLSLDESNEPPQMILKGGLDPKSNALCMERLQKLLFPPN